MRKTLAGCHALLGEDARPSNGPVDVVIDGHYIQEVRPSGVAPPEGEKIDLAGRLLTAGLINGHHHSHEGYYKGRKDNLPLELWMNYVRPLKPIELTPREVYLRTMIGAIEAVHSGTTTLCDDTNVSPRIIPEHVEAVFQAYEDIGIRAYVGITLFDRPFFRACPSSTRSFRRSSWRSSMPRKCIPAASCSTSPRASPVTSQVETGGLYRGAVCATALQRGFSPRRAPHGG